MRSLFKTVLTLLFAAAVSAISTAGGRLLVVLDDLAEKDSYGQFLGDIAGTWLTGGMARMFWIVLILGHMQLEAFLFRMRHQRARSWSCSTSAREYTTTFSSCPLQSRVRCLTQLQSYRKPLVLTTA